MRVMPGEPSRTSQHIPKPRVRVPCHIQRDLAFSQRCSSSPLLLMVRPPGTLDCWKSGSPHLSHDAWSQARALLGRQLGESLESPREVKSSGLSQPCHSTAMHPRSCPEPCPASPCF